MKRLFCASILFLAGVAALNAAVQPNVQLFPLGGWLLCETPAAADFSCRGFTPGNEQYLLNLQATSDATQRFVVTMQLTMTDGTIKVYPEFDVLRQDSPQGWTGVAITTGGVVKAYTITVKEFVQTAVTVAQS